MTNAPIVCARLDRQAVAGLRCQWVALIVFRFDAKYGQVSAASPWAAVALWCAWRAAVRARRVMAKAGPRPCVAWSGNPKTARHQAKASADAVPNPFSEPDPSPEVGVGK